MRLGIDWGGTKIEIVALDDNGDIVLRERTPTPRDDYQGCIDTVYKLVTDAEAKLGETGTVGFGIPGTISPASGLVMNANSTWMNGQPLKEDLEEKLGREVRIENDANCLVVSEAADGAGAGHRVVAGIIIGTGCGSGIVIEGKALSGRTGIATEIGHTALAPLTAEEFPGNICWCGKRACLETYVAGPAFQRDYDQRIGKASGLSAREILATGDEASKATYATYVDRLGRGLSTLVNLVDPDIIVLGGGMSNIDALYDDLPDAIRPYAFTDNFETPIVKAMHGDSSGVRGAAWLW